MTLPELLAIEPLAHAPYKTVHVPGSKSITNRALILAALASWQGDCVLENTLHSEDTEVMVDSLRKLGFHIGTEWEAPVPRIRIRHSTGTDLAPIPATEAELQVVNSGTSMRFLTALTCLGNGRFRLDGSARMRERPIEDLLSALRQVGVRAECERHDGCPPVVVMANGIRGGSLEIKGDISSQFLSGLLLAAPAALGTLDITVAGQIVSRPYVDMTVRMVRQFGGKIDIPGPGRYVIPGKQRLRATSYRVEPDASAACFFWSAAAITGGTITVSSLRRSSLQGDIAFLEVLEQMGCRTSEDSTGLTVRGGHLTGVEVDMNAISDGVMALAAVACFAEGPTTIRNVEHVRYKESDRIHALATELRKIGPTVTELVDGLTIVPRPLCGANLDTYEDHRMAMSLALLGLRVPGIVICNPACVGKTYPSYFEDLKRLSEVNVA